MTNCHFKFLNQKTLGKCRKMHDKHTSHTYSSLVTQKLCLLQPLRRSFSQYKIFLVIPLLMVKVHVCVPILCYCLLISVNALLSEVVIVLYMPFVMGSGKHLVGNNPCVSFCLCAGAAGRLFQAHRCEYFLPLPSETALCLPQ